MWSCAFYSGRTQIAAGSRTVLGIGPGELIINDKNDCETHLLLCSPGRDDQQSDGKTAFALNNAVTWMCDVHRGYLRNFIVRGFPTAKIL